MNKKRAVIAILVIAVAVASGWWFAQKKGHVPRAEHQHLLIPKTDEQGKVYYSLSLIHI